MAGTYIRWPAGSGGTSGVTSLNSLTGALTIAAGTGITVTPSGGDTLTIAATGGNAITSLTGDVTATGPGAAVATIANGAISLSGAKVTGTLPLANGGTGQTSASTAINALVPTQSGHSGEFLTTNGTAVSWAAASGGGMAIGGAITSSTPGSVLYVDASSQLAQDNANFFWDATNHRLGVGNVVPNTGIHSGVAYSSSLLPSAGTADRLSIASLNDADARFDIITSSSNGAQANTGIIRFINAQGSVSAPSSVASGHKMGAIQFYGFDGTDSILSADIRSNVSGAVSAGVVPSTMLFRNTSAAGTLSSFMSVANTQAVTLPNLAGSAGIVHASSTGLLSNSLIINADVDAAAAITYSKLNLATSILNGDISTSAAIAYSKLATLNTGSILLGNAGVPTATALTGDVTVGATGVTAIGASKVTNTMLAGSIDLTAKVTGVLPIANGGTNSTATATAGGVGYGTGSAHAYTSAGTSGQYLKSNAGSAPAFASFTAPTVQKFTSGSGTYTTPAGVLYIRVRMVGGGGGGAGSSTTSADGGAGNVTTASTATTFGSSLLNAGAGGGGQSAAGSGDGGTGGTASLGTGPVGIAIPGSRGGSFLGNATNLRVPGGVGGTSALGGSGGGGTPAVAGSAAATNSGSGGGGAGAPTAGYSGAGGGSGGYVDAIITSPSATYAYVVGVAGTGGNAGSSGFAGGAGAAGIIEVTEYYQ